MNEALWTAIIVAVPAVLTSVLMPLAMARMTFKQKVADRNAEWERQDRLATAVKDTAQKVADDLAMKGAERAGRADMARQELSDRVDVIHHLVNGNVTTAMQAEHDGLIREVVLRRQVRVLKERYGEPHDPVSSAAITLAEARISELRGDLQARFVQKITPVQTTPMTKEVHEKPPAGDDLQHQEKGDG